MCGVYFERSIAECIYKRILFFSFSGNLFSTLARNGCHPTIGRANIAFITWHARKFFGNPEETGGHIFRVYIFIFMHIRICPHWLRFFRDFVSSAACTMTEPTSLCFFVCERVGSFSASIFALWGPVSILTYCPLLAPLIVRACLFVSCLVLTIIFSVCVNSFFFFLSSLLPSSPLCFHPPSFFRFFLLKEGHPGMGCKQSCLQALNASTFWVAKLLS